MHRAVDGLLRGLIERQSQEGTARCYPSMGSSPSLGSREKTAVPFPVLGVKEVMHTHTHTHTHTGFFITFYFCKAFQFCTLHVE